MSDAEEENGAGAALRQGSMAERARYIPLRLSQEERRLLRLLEAALSVSEYTDKARPAAGALRYCRQNSRCSALATPHLRTCLAWLHARACT